MTLFILLALVLSLLAAAFVTLPLLRARPGLPRALRGAAVTVLLLLGAGAGLYAWLGNTAWSAGPGSGESTADQTIPTLARHLERNPDDLSGWIELGQAYSAIGNYSLALRCYERVNRLSGGQSAAALAGMAESMLMSGDAAEAPKAEKLLERALQIEPHQPKGLFYSAVAAYRDGRLAVARDRFSMMLALGPPESVRVALQRQIDDIDAQLKNPPQMPSSAGAAATTTPAAAPSAAPAAAPSAASGGKADAGTAIHLRVTLSPGLDAQLPAQAALFVFVRAPGGGPPLAVKRIEAHLPQDVELSAADAMVAGRAVEPGQSVSVVARLSASGNPLPQSGDLVGEIQTVAGRSGTQPLQIDHRTP